MTELSSVERALLAGEDAGSGAVARYAGALVDWPTLWARERSASDWLCEPILPRARAVSTFSKAKAGKSLLAFDVAARLATGLRVLDRPTSERVTVLYVDLEMTEDDVHERLEEMGFKSGDDLSRLVYYLLPSLPPLDTPEGGRDLCELARAHDAALVVIDTTTTATTGRENDSDTIRDYWRHTGRPLKTDGRTVWRLDHAGKDVDRGQRGSSAKDGDVDVVWELTAREGSALRLRATHRRLGWVPERVDLVRMDDRDGLRHEIATESYPAGTADVVRLLDELGVPLDASQRGARAQLREASRSASNDVLMAALRYRRNGAS